MATMPAASVLGEDGGRSAGEVAPGVTLVKNVRIPVRDGTRLAADVYFPSSALEAGDPVSLVMEYIPYRKDEVAPGHRFYEYLPQQGYAVARVDIRGSGASPGTTRDEYLLQEQLDGVDCVEWFGGRPWCTGHVNMMGISYGGFTSSADREPRARAFDEHHPDVLHRRPLHGRLPFPRRSDAQVLRRHLVRQHDGRLECVATVSGLVGRLGGSVAGAPRWKRALPARVVPPPGRLRLLGATAPWGARSRACAAPRS